MASVPSTSSSSSSQNTLSTEEIKQSRSRGQSASDRTDNFTRLRLESELALVAQQAKSASAHHTRQRSYSVGSLLSPTSKPILVAQEEAKETKNEQIDEVELKQIEEPEKKELSEEALEAVFVQSRSQRLTKAISKVIPQATLDDLASEEQFSSTLLSPRVEDLPQKVKNDLRAFNDEKFAREMLKARKQLQSGKVEPRFLFMVEEFIVRTLGTFQTNIPTDISGNLEHISVRSGDTVTSFPLLAEEQFGERCTAFADLISALSLGISKYVNVSEVVKVWDEYVQKWKTKTYDEATFACCVKEFYDRIKQEEDPILSRLAWMLNSLSQHTYAAPSKQLGQIFSEITIDYKQKNLSIEYCLDEVIELNVQWDLEFPNLGFLRFSHQLIAHPEELSKWSSNIQLNFNQPWNVEPEKVQREVIEPLTRAGFNAKVETTL